MGLDIHHTPSIHTSSLRPSPPSDDRPSLPSIGLSISRPSSRLSTTSTRSLSSGYYEAARQHVQLPGLSALASIAANTSPPERQLSQAPQPGVNFLGYTPTPSAAPGGIGTAPPVCQNCSTSTTPLWRRDENGSVLCNACGLFLKLHGKPRPISLKTDVIKSRNRVKATGKRSTSHVSSQEQQPRIQQVSLAASHPGISHLNPEQRPHFQPQSASTDSSTTSPMSRSGTPGLNGHNIAPQHMFDQVIQIPGSSENYGPSPSISQFTFRANSPGAASTSSLLATSAQAGSATGQPDIPQDVTAIKTRVSELEVINDLFRGRVAELEALLAEKQQQAELDRQEKEQLRMDLEQARRKIEELENEGGEHRSKRLRVEDFVRDDASGSDN
ncbi:protein GZF3 [Verruconis gallopava]|uniref:Protein GZF3 n=1 Tax=Verruconis gallopava TaxID=253628 RepID=A0A0D2A824_9PEZI|nr:protein GZF3 [Verruconis gallopava]KIW02735.1 protein GZF3 [Verruconis gallopava]